MAVATASRTEQGKAFQEFQAKVAALRLQWAALAERHGIDAFARQRGDDGLAELDCAAIDAGNLET